MKINCSQILKFIFSQLNSNDKNVTIYFMTNDVMSPAFPWGASQTVCVITTSLAATSEKCSQWLYNKWQIPEGNSGWQPRYNKFHFYTWWLILISFTFNSIILISFTFNSISNHILSKILNDLCRRYTQANQSSKVWDEITFPFPNNHWSLEMD